MLLCLECAPPLHFTFFYVQDNRRFVTGTIERNLHLGETRYNIRFQNYLPRGILRPINIVLFFEQYHSHFSSQWNEGGLNDEDHYFN